MTELPKTGVEVLVRALEIWGPNGEHWIQGKWYAEGNYCLLGGLDMAAHGRVELPINNPYLAARALVQVALNSTQDTLSHYFIITRFNDSPRTTFADVKALVCGAIQKELGKEIPDAV